MIEADQRAAVVAESRRWIGAKWHHEALVRYEAVDCAMLLKAVFETVGLIDPSFDPRPYARDWMFHQKEERFLHYLQSLGATETGNPQVGDIVLWKVGHTLSHAGIVSAWPWVIHAYAQARQVQEDDISLPGIISAPEFPRRFFSFWGAV